MIILSLSDVSLFYRATLGRGRLVIPGLDSHVASIVTGPYLVDSLAGSSTCSKLGVARDNGGVYINPLVCRRPLECGYTGHQGQMSGSAGEPDPLAPNDCRAMDFS